MPKRPVFNESRDGDRNQAPRDPWTRPGAPQASEEQVRSTFQCPWGALLTVGVFQGPPPKAQDPVPPPGLFKGPPPG